LSRKASFLSRKAPFFFIAEIISEEISRRKTFRLIACGLGFLQLTLGFLQLTL
jgi:hypothetical protein